METQVFVIFYVNGAPVTSGGTFLLMRAGIHAPTFQGAAVFVCNLYGIVAPRAHFLPGRAEGRTASRVKIDRRAASGLLEAGCPLPIGSGYSGKGLVKKKRKKDKGTQDLCLVFGGASAVSVKLWDVLCKWIEIQIQKQKQN